MLLTVAKTWKRPERPSVDREIKKICLHTYTHTSPQREDYYLGINKKGILPFARTYVDPGGTMLSERGQTKTDKHCMISLVYVSKTLERIETENRRMVTGGHGMGEMQDVGQRVQTPL